MRPLRLELEGFQSYSAPTEIDLGGLDAAVIIGPNRAGKTTLIEAIAWALYGKSRGATSDSVLSYTATRCRVVLDFTVSGGHWRVERQRDRSRGGSSALELMTSGPNGTWDWEPAGSDRIAETQERIDYLLGMDYETWMATSFIGQGRADAFTRMRAGERKELLAEVLQLGMYETLADQAREDERTASAQRDAATDIVQRVELYVAENGGAGDRLTELQEGARNLDAELEERAAALEAARNDLDLARGAMATAEVNRALYEELEEARGRINADLVDIPNAPECRAAVEELTEKHGARDAGLIEADAQLAAKRDDYRQASMIAAATKADFVRATEEREEFLEAPDVCPLCRQRMTPEHRTRVLGDMEIKRGKLMEQARRAAELEDGHAASLRDLVGRRDELVLDARRVGDLLTEAKELLRTRESFDAGVVAAEQKIKALTDRGAREPVDEKRLQQQVAEATATVARMTADVGDDRQRREGLAREIGKAEAAVTRLEEATKQQAEYALKASAFEEQRQLAEWASKACGKDGVPARLIEAAIPAIEDAANGILEHLMGELTVTLQSTRATKSRPGVKETLDVIVVSDGEDRPLEELSGSERQSVDLSLRLGLSMMLAGRTGSPVDCLFIDEGFTAYDSEHRQNVPGILRKLANRFPMVLLVTHESLFADAFGARIVVGREDGSSRVTVEAG